MEELILYGCKNFPEIRDKFVEQIICNIVKTKSYDLLVKYLDIALTFDKYFLEWNVTNKLFDDNQYEIILLIVEKTSKMNGYIFSYDHILQIFRKCDLELLKKFIKCYPDILSYRYIHNDLSEILRQRDDMEIIKLAIDTISETSISHSEIRSQKANFVEHSSTKFPNSNIKFLIYYLFKQAIYYDDIKIAKYCLDNYSDIIEKDLSRLLSGYYEDNFDVFKMILLKYPDSDKQLFYNNAYKWCNIKFLKYLLNNYDYDVNMIYDVSHDRFNENIQTTVEIMLDDILKRKLLIPENATKIFEIVHQVGCVNYIHIFQNFNISNDVVLIAFKHSCKYGQFEMAKVLKQFYPEIDHRNIFCPERFVDMRKWLENDCIEIYTNIKSSRKIYS